MSAARTAADTKALTAAAALLAASAVGVRCIQPRLASECHTVKETEDVYLFPPPSELRAATLGYIAATTDILWVTLLVEHGTHWGEHRAFPDLNRYLDAINDLDPTFMPFYEYVDALLCFRPPHGEESDARAARTYLHRGIEVLPYNPETWLHYGQFVGFLAPSFLSDERERAVWRREGAMALNHAVDLGADVERGIAASEVLGRSGELDAAISGLERVYALTDDEAYRLEISAKIEQLRSDPENQKALARRGGDVVRDAMNQVESRWRRDYPFLDRGTYLLVGPLVDPLRCAGFRPALDRACARDWASILGP